MKRKEEREWTREKRRRGKERADDLFLMAVCYDKGLMNNMLSNTAAQNSAGKTRLLTRLESRGYSKLSIF